MKIHKFAIMLTGVMIITLSLSCKKFLTEEPTIAVSENDAFNSVENARMSVYGAYSQLSGDNGFGNRLSCMYPYDNDEMLQYINGNIPDNADRDMSRYALTPTNAQLAKPFTQLYTGVERANLCIKHIPLMPQYAGGTAEEQAELKRLHGEALTLRALFYLELVKHWGDVPAQWVPSVDLEDINLPKTDHNVIYDHLLDDLLTAEDLVPWRKDSGVTDNERITKGAVKGLRARIALFRGGYSLQRDSRTMKRMPDYLDFYKIARQECFEIMQHRDKHNLNPSFQAVFKDALMANKLEPNGEVLLEVAMGGGVNISDSKLGSFDGPKVFGKGNGRVTLTPSYFYAFHPLDGRRSVTAASYVVATGGFRTSSSILNIASGKFRRDWVPVPLEDGGTYFGVNWPLIRFSDILLMFAEAENEISQHPTPAAVAAFEEVRKRGFGPNAANIGASPDNYLDFFKAIVNERSFEFGGEGIRKYDLIRWNLLYEKILETRATLTRMRKREAPYNTGYPLYMYYKTSSADLIYANSFYATAPTATPAGYTRVNWLLGLGDSYLALIAPDFVPNHSEVYPLPQTAIENNKNLQQDYGY